ncbi:MAG: hypothetical protein IJO29_05020 [Oscillospiraceae bacterium]|nr:hypothetical protein [Oscillospiraceae bacterium]
MMKDNEKLLDAIGNVSDEFVPDVVKEAETTPVGKKRISFAPLVSVAAGAVLIGGAAIGIRELESDNEDAVSYSHFDESQEEYLDSNIDYSKLEILNPEIDFGAMGYEGYMVYDIAEIDTSNPYNSQIGLSAMPVYKNLSYDAVMKCSGMSVYFSEEELAAIAQDTADALRLKIENVNIEFASDYTTRDLGEYADIIYSYEAECDGTKYGLKQINIRVFGDGEICVDMDANFSGGLKLPSGCSFTYNSTSDEEALATLEYFKDEFAELLSFENPTAFSWGDRTYSGEKIRKYYIYDKSVDYKQDLLNYNFSSVEFCPDDSGNLMCIWMRNSLISEYVAEYPIISDKEAQNLLCEEKYISSVPQEYLNNGKVTEEDIKKVELVYLTNINRQEYYIPYYKFYVELSDEQLNSEEGLKTYGAFYVPAVSGEYLTEYPSADSTVIYGGC